MMKRKYTLLIVLISTLVFSQKSKNINALQVLKKTIEFNDKKKIISYNTKYILYLDYSSSKVYEQYSGIVLKKYDVNYFRIKNTEFVSFNDYGLKINNDQKAMVIERQEGNVDESPLSLNQFLKGFNYKITENKDLFVCELIPNKYSNVMVNKVILYIKKSNYSLVKQVLFLVEKMESKDAKGIVKYTIPRLEISLAPRNNAEKSDDFLLTKENYFTQKNNNITVSKRFSTYQLFKS